MIQENALPLPLHLKQQKNGKFHAVASFTVVDPVSVSFARAKVHRACFSAPCARVKKRWKSARREQLPEGSPSPAGIISPLWCIWTILSFCAPPGLAQYNNDHKLHSNGGGKPYLLYGFPHSLRHLRQLLRKQQGFFCSGKQLCSFAKNCQALGRRRVYKLYVLWP